MYKNLELCTLELISQCFSIFLALIVLGWGRMAHRLESSQPEGSWCSGSHRRAAIRNCTSSHWVIVPSHCTIYLYHITPLLLETVPSVTTDIVLLLERDLFLWEWSHGWVLELLNVGIKHEALKPWKYTGQVHIRLYLLSSGLWHYHDSQVQ